MKSPSHVVFHPGVVLLANYSLLLMFYFDSTDFLSNHISPFQLGLVGEEHRTLLSNLLWRQATKNHIYPSPFHFLQVMSVKVEDRGHLVQGLLGSISLEQLS